MKKSSFEIWLENVCKLTTDNIKFNYIRKGEIEREGWVSFNINEPKSSYPYIEAKEQLIWNTGWELNRIETIWRNAVN